MTTLFHVTRNGLAASIWAEGVSPKYATGKMAVAWWVVDEMVVWALSHVSARWSVSVDRLIVVEADISASLIHRWSMPGVYHVGVPVMVGSLWGYEKWVKPEI
jgi:hypothetical protein